MLQRLVRIAQKPADIPEKGDADHPCVFAIEHDLGVVQPAIVAGQSPLEMRAGGGKLAKPVQRIPQRPVGLHEECGVLLTRGQGEELFSPLARRVILGAHIREAIQPKKGREELRLRTEGRQSLRCDGEVQDVTHEGHVLRGGQATLTESVLDGSRMRHRLVALSDAAELPQHIAHRQVGCRLAVGETLAHIDCHWLAGETLTELGQEP